MKSKQIMPKGMGMRLRRLHKDPDTRLLNEYLVRAYDVGWSYHSLSLALGITRKAIQDRVKTGRKRRLTDQEVATWNWPLPTPTRADGSIEDNPFEDTHISRPKDRFRKQRQLSMTLLTADVVAELRRLAAIAGRAQGSLDLDDPRRVASDKLVAMIWDLRCQGCLMTKIDAAVGWTSGVAHHRLASHGYIKPPNHLVRDNKLYQNTALERSIKRGKVKLEPLSDDDEDVA